MKILGYHFLSLVNRKINQSESARLTAAEKTVKQIRALPGSLARRSRLARMTVCPKASWGWICKRPSLKNCKPLLKACKELFKWPKHGSVDLIMLIQGHHWDLRYLATAAMLRIWYRFCQNHMRCFEGWPIKRSGFTGTLRVSLDDLGWEEISESPWAWTRSGTGDTFSLDPSKRSWCSDQQHLQHMLRHSWRFSRFEKWKQSCRRDTENCIETPFDDNRLKLIHKRNLTSHELAVLTGAAVSPARYFVMMKDNPEERSKIPNWPWCGLMASKATWNHVAWTCPFLIFPPNLCPRNLDPLLKRLGWPNTSKDFHVLQWLAMVRAKTLGDRRPA